MTDDTLTRVQRLLARALRIEASDVHPDSRLVTDLGARSIDVIQVILDLEEEFATTIPDCDITPAPFDLFPEMTVSDLAEMIHDYLPRSSTANWKSFHGPH
jgi:acyl carrier protein